MTESFRFFDHIGSIGALLAAVAAPCCFPIFAALSATVGLTAFGPYERFVLVALQTFAVLSLLGLALAYSRHRNIAPLLIGIASVLSLGYSFYWSVNTIALYAGLFGLVLASALNFVFSRQRREAAGLLLRSVITCPQCGGQSEETMPTDACLFFYDCKSCGIRLKPKPGDCCVFCSYGSVSCPPIQLGRTCCT